MITPAQDDGIPSVRISNGPDIPLDRHPLSMDFVGVRAQDRAMPMPCVLGRFLVVAAALYAGAEAPAHTHAQARTAASVEDLITIAGNEENDVVRLGHLRKLADQCAREGLTLAGLDRLIDCATGWVSPEVRLDFFDREVQRTLEYDFGITEDSPLRPLAALYRARMLTWVTLEYSDIYPYPEKRSAFLNRARAQFEDARRAFPENRVIGMYLGEPFPAPRRYDAPGGAPAWAVAQRAGLEHLADIIEWWIDHRLRPNGEYGGGWGDDCEMWRHWAPVLIGFDFPKANRAQAYFSERLLAQPHLAGGFHSRMMDVEHTTEDVADALTPMMHLAPENPEWAQRALRLVELCENLWTGRNERGFLQFKSTYFTAAEVDLTPARACDTVYHPRALQPALLYWQRTRDPRITRLMTDWMKTWVDAAAREERGKPGGILPTAIHWPDGRMGGVGQKWWMPENYETPLYDFPSMMGLMLSTLLQTWHQTGDESFLAPIRSMAEARSAWMRADQTDYPEGSRMWCAERLDQLAGVLAKYRSLTGDTRFDVLLQAETGQPYARFRLDGDLAALTVHFEQLAGALRVNFPSYTQEVRYTDRVMRFPILYQPGWMLEAGARDPLLLLEGGVMAMGLNRVHLLYHTVTGDPGDPLYFPLNAVRWHTPPRDLAALVTDATPQRFQARLYHFGESERRFDCELFLLVPGEYEISLLAPGRPVQRQRATIANEERRVSVLLPPRAECVLRIEAVSPPKGAAP